MESRIAATHRLQSEGRWDEASSFRDEVRRELRDKGLSRKAANEQAWPKMIEKFPPVEDDKSVPCKDHGCEIDDAAMEELLDHLWSACRSRARYEMV